MPTDPCVDLQTTHGDTIVATIHQATNPHGLPIQHHDTRRTALDCHKPGPMRQHCQRRAGHTELRHTSWGKTDDDTVFQLEWLEPLADTELSIVDDEDD